MTLAITSAIPVQQAVYTHPITPFPTVTITDPNQTVTLTITETTHKPGIDFSGHIGGDLLAGLITLTDPNAATDGSITNTFNFTLSGTPATVTQALDQLQFDPSGFLTDPPSDSRLTLTVHRPHRCHRHHRHRPHQQSHHPHPKPLPLLRPRHR